MRLRPGDTFDRYVIEAPLGEGGMGEVYQARDTKLQRRVALKLLRKEAATEPEAWKRAVHRMLREARAAAALSHPNTVAIYDIGEMDGAPYLAMEFIDGVSLRQLIAGSSSSPRRLSWLIDVARALSAAHREGLVHRDIKPENVMLRDDGMIKVLDFGIARKMRLGLDTRGSTLREADLDPPSSRRGDTVTGEGVMVGTPAYMAPEQLRGDPVDARTDQFGWGVLAYELLTGRLPFGPNLEGVRLLSAILADEPPPLDGFVPPPVERILRRAVAKKPAERWPSMDHVIEALQPFVTGEGLTVPDDVLIADAGEEHDEHEEHEEHEEDDIDAGADTAPAGRSRTTTSSGSAPMPRTMATPTPRSPGGAPSSRASRPHVNTVRSPSPVASARSRGTPPPSVRIEKAPPAPPLRPPSPTTLESPTAMAVRAAQRAAAGQRKWQLFAAASIAVIGVLVLAAGIVSRLRRNANTTADPAPAPTTASTPITELPPPLTSNQEALAAYREGLQSLRDASWGLAYGAFERAIKLEPSLGAAHLRMAMIDRFRGKTASTRAEFQRAVELRASLSERDQVVLDAFEPLVQRDPPDFVETTRRFEAAVQKYPGDAELACLLLMVQVEAPPERMLTLADRCLELDQRYADCWQARALALFRDERIPEAIESLDRCVELAPAATDCLIERIRFQKIMGRCSKLEADARRWIAKDQSSPYAYQELAVALEATGQPLGAVGAAVDQAAKRFREAGLAETAINLRINLTILSGHFDEAERLARDFEREMTGESQEEKHTVAARALVQLDWEMGQDKKAGEVAEQFLTQRAAWVRPLRWTPWSDPEILFLKAKQRAGMLDEAGYLAARDAWIDGWKSRDADPAALWVVGKALPARSEAEAREALAESPVKRPHAFHPQVDVSQVIAVLGELAFLSGRYDAALPRLEDAARSCTALDDPLRHTIATYHLGVVHESRKEKAEACAAYKVVLRRWGQTDESETAKAAARRAKALGCTE